MRVAYAETIYGKEEVKAVMDVLKNPHHIVAGPQVKEFEKKVAALFGKKHGVMVNSGSSANLIGLSVLDLPKGSEVITPALTFSTTLAPILQTGLTPIFVDVELGTYLVNPKTVESLITSRTSALMIPSLLGNIPDLKALRQLADKHSLRLFEDSCDTLGSRFDGKPTGTFSDVSTTSFYASHIITAAGGGGMACFNDPVLAERALVMSYWGRRSTLFGAYEKSEEIQKRFAGLLQGEAYDAKFIFSEVGYNFQPTELMGAFGLAQLKRLKNVAARRKKNFKALLAFFKNYEDVFVLPKAHPDADPNWLAFPLMLKESAPFDRLALARYLEERNIQTRPIFTGNVLRQPAFAYLGKDRVARFPATDTIMRRGLLIGCHHGLTDRHLQYLQDTFAEFLGKREVTKT
ncbi:aminotransferase class I/II-fold pyridoxal phosphate-dependent enzyme [Candidatus Peregrinibacteria bacterium]|nr:aminotransferase class I/II-fold pyridoxal phosphate-dependent enzyme [Candidatus Peregrinibacteria bacterium]